MKKVFALVALGATLVGISPRSSYYARLMRVVDTSNDTITMVDCNGEEWQWDGVEDIEVGDYLSCVLNNCGTNSIKDDEIISIRYERVDKLEERGNI